MSKRFHMVSEMGKKDRILEAAEEVFLRYGFKKATMGDIADKAGMSRPSLYVVFPNKEEIFRAVIARKEAEFFSATETRLSRQAGLRERIAAVLEIWILAPFEMVRTSPEADELFDFAYSFAPDLRQRMLEKIGGQLLQAMQPGAAPTSGVGGDSNVSPELIAQLIAVSTFHLKHSIKDVAELRNLLHAMVELCAFYLDQNGRREN